MARALYYGFRDRDIQQAVNGNAETVADLEASVAVLEPLTGQVAAVEVQLGPTGSATIANGAASVGVTHNYGSTAYTVSLLPTSDLGAGQRFWVSTKALNSFVINLSSTASGAKTFDWIVRGD